MGNIVLLDELTINQIAAGEVIERPASVVKELVENSIDAGATSIFVDIKNGGISSIRITDNGKGIQKDDMQIAFERHATSKIRTAEDLETVTSMGFRGEALASIAAISNIEMISRTEDDDYGYKIVVEAGDILEEEIIGASLGTTITVRNLFFNTPVRYKFLKKDYTELGYIEDVMTRMALINPNIAFTLTNNEKTILQTNGDGNVKNCIYSILGKDIANGIVDINYEYENIKITGVIGKPEIARNNRINQMFFVNKRYVKDKTLSAAIEQAYKGMLTVGKHAFCIMNIGIEPNEIDVNVHPTKMEIRFKEENKVFKAIYNGIKESLLNADLIANSSRNENEELIEGNEQFKNNMIENDSKGRFSSLFKRKPQNLNWDNEEVNQRINLVEDLYNSKQQDNNLNNIVQNSIDNHEKIENTKEEESNTNYDEISNNIKLMEQQLNNLENIKNEDKKIEEKSEDNVIEDVKYKFEEMYEKTFGKKINVQEIKEETEDYKVEEQIEKNEEKGEEISKTNNVELENKNMENISIFEEKENYIEPIKYKFIGIAFSTYIILEINEEMYILDQHAAHERIMYEKIKKNFYNNEAKDSQMMLLPDIINLSHKEMEVARENYKMFEKAGFTLEEFGDNTIKLTGVPNICIDLDTKELFLDILDEIDTLSVTARQEIEEKFIATVACKSAVKANMALDYQEVEALMNDLLKLPNPFTCPHGRPTVIKMSKMEIEKKFSRR